MTRTIRKMFASLTLMILMIGALPQVQASINIAQYPNRFSRVASVSYVEAPITPEELEEVRAKSNSALSFLEAFWSRALSGRFTPPSVWEDSQTDAAHYSPNTNSIHLNPVFLVREKRAAASNLGTDGDMAFIIILAHEYGHAVQAHIELPPCLNRELHADTLAGVFTRAAKQAGLLDPGDEEEASNSLLRAGGGDHGTGPQRVAAFNYGYAGGARNAFKCR